MKKDIAFKPVEGVSLAIAQQNDELPNPGWHVYIINQNEMPLDNIMITSKGYGHKEGEVQRTSTLRQFIEKLEPKSHAVIERIDPEVFHLNNEFWVSYYIDGHIYDKKFIFSSGSIMDENISLINELNLKGVLHS